MQQTDMYEGSVIRVIRRLEELIRQLATASHGLGDPELKNKFEATANKIRRDIPFAGRSVDITCRFFVFVRGLLAETVYIGRLTHLCT